MSRANVSGGRGADADEVEGDLVGEATRRRLSKRQADMVRRLTTAALEELRETGYSNLTVRGVAARAEVAPATAYTYFASKNHLITELLWRRLRSSPPAAEAGQSTSERVVGVLRELALLMVDEPELAAACTSAMLGDDSDVAHLRLRIGMEIRQRLEAALGPGYDPAVLLALEFAYAGALVHAGMGAASYEAIADGLAATAELITEGRS
ncbi:AcrR family transcriptional regulator [Saccharomonospora amisosensis]|uniref:AcrR family transcriptional regulator n=1 Tax=Saccharomonospora amisosensis TaxID=1128677 RepID=A0A7X5ZTE6_9PSEU|nr:TetR/AcrR family transcriptional regulator [Saccharomonospora amisosensis]NIJ14877.1 AcrR family transcriptional regulator [Saccharomonospora amisosensis]